MRHLNIGELDGGLRAMVEAVVAECIPVWLGHELGIQRAPMPYLTSTLVRDPAGLDAYHAHGAALQVVRDLFPTLAEPHASRAAAGLCLAGLCPSAPDHQLLVE